MNKTKAKLPKPSKINRKLTLLKETIAQVHGGEDCTENCPTMDFDNPACLLYTC